LYTIIYKKHLNDIFYNSIAYFLFFKLKMSFFAHFFLQTDVVVLYLKYNLHFHKKMFTRLFSATVLGVDVKQIDIEVDVALGLINWQIVGLPDAAVKESKQRISAAIKNSGIKLPDRKVTISLSPADMKKEGSLFDLPIAIALLNSSKIISISQHLKNEAVLIGEIALDGALRGVGPVFAIASEIMLLGKSFIVVPYDKAEEASLVNNIKVIAPKNLQELVSWFLLDEMPIYKKRDLLENDVAKNKVDLSDVCGNDQAKRALQISAAGGHALLFIGSPGVGKTMLAERLSTLLPKMSVEEQLEVSKIHSIHGRLDINGLIKSRPFQSPHHTISTSGMVGGGSYPKPGAVSLAHRGVLFLDELLEYRRSCLEVLRQPIESKKITISRANLECTFPADFILLAATNPCPCGYYGDKRYNCTCSTHEIRQYLRKISGPLLDRIDLHVGIYSTDKVVDGPRKRSEDYRSDVERARRIQKNRFNTHITLNATMGVNEIKRYCVMSDSAKEKIDRMYKDLSMSMRGYNKIIKISRTIADLDNSETIEFKHIAESLAYRIVDRMQF
jgi:magnesium chelatase family protein